MCRCYQSHHAVLGDNCGFVLFLSFHKPTKPSWPRPPQVRMQVSLVSLYNRVLFRVFRVYNRVLLRVFRGTKIITI